MGWEAGTFTVSFLLFIGIILLVDYVVKRYFKPYITKKAGSFSTTIRIGVISTVALREKLGRDTGVPALRRRAQRVIRSCYDKFQSVAARTQCGIAIVSQAVNDGASALAYEGIGKRKWETVGIATKGDTDGRALYPCTSLRIVGTAPGDEAKELLSGVDILVLLSDGSDPGDPYEAAFHDFKEMKMHFNLSTLDERALKPDIFNASSGLADLAKLE